MKIILLTGATDGIGKEVAKQLFALEHKVLLHGRNPSKLKAVAEELGIEETYVADLSDLSQVYSMAKEIQQNHDRIDVLLNNAGVFKTSEPMSCQGLDIRFAVNTIAPYILTKELIGSIPKHGRVVNVASAAQASVSLQHAFTINGPPFHDFQAYAQSKLAMMMWSATMAQKYPDRTIVSVNPASMIGTKMVKEAYGVAGKDLSVGADILVQAAVGKKFAKASGKYFDNDSERFTSPHPDVLDPEKNQQVVEAMETLLSSLLK